jgi:dTDP-4-dehydrorhamnose reductase
MRILITGAHGQVGSAVAAELSPDHAVIALDRSRFDLTQRIQIRDAIRSIRPDCIINAAGYTAVDEAEREPEAARAANAIAPGILAEEALHIGALLLHFSTDYVFDGRKAGPYVETDIPNPLNHYGESKLAGERAIQDGGAAALILRASWVYSASGNNFFLKILKLLSSKREIRVVADQVGAPTSALALARAVKQIIPSFAQRRRPGIYHLSAAGATSWHGFAEAICAAARSAGQPFLTTQIIPISSEEFGAPARRPANSVLSNAKVKREFGVELPDWREQFAEVFSQYLQSRSAASHT